jgi:DGQHR domain-containing protein
MKIQAFRISQHRKEFFLTVMNAQQLVADNIQPDIWSPKNPEGYQRELQLGRARSFGKFIKNTDNISPTAVLLSIREPVEFTSREGNYGTLEIPDNVIFYEVDGQHRIGGLKEIIRRGPLNVSLPVVILCPLLLSKKKSADQRFFEAKQFVVINRMQKKVRADLSDRFIARLTTSQMQELGVLGRPSQLEKTKSAVKISDILRRKRGSVWYRKIKIPSGGPGIVSQRTFTVPLVKYVLDEEIFGGMSVEELAEVLDNYWSAWKNLCPTAFAQPQNYVIQKTGGAYILNSLFVVVVKWLNDLGLELSKDNFTATLENMTEGNIDVFWSAESPGIGALGSGVKFYEATAKRLQDAFRSGNIVALKKSPI